MQMRTLPPELQEVAEKELNEDPSKIEEDLNHIREWLAKQPHLTAKQDDQTLVLFLRECKYSLQKTKDKIDYYYTLRSTVPFLVNKDPFSADIQAILKASALAPLPKTIHANGCRIAILRYEHCNPDIMPVTALLKSLIMTLDILLNEDDNSIVSGLIWIIDFKEWNLNYLPQYTPTLLHQIVLCIQSAYPFRLKKVICINVPAAVVAVYELLKPIFGEKLRKRIILYSEANLPKLYEIIPKSILPRELNGESGPFANMADTWRKKVESYQNWFAEDSKYYSNENLRLEKSKLDFSLYGVEGSFRKLNID